MYRHDLGVVTTEVSLEPVTETIAYAAVVRTVELLKGGELTHGSARELSDHGWGLELHRDEIVQRVLSLSQEQLSEKEEEGMETIPGGLMSRPIRDNEQIALVKPVGPGQLTIVDPAAGGSV